MRWFALCATSVAVWGARLRERWQDHDFSMAMMQEVSGSNPRLGGLRVSQFQASGGISTLQSRASGLQSTTQGNSISTTKDSSESKEISLKTYVV